MKIAVSALLVGSVSAFTTPPLTFAVGKKAPAKVAPKAAPAAKTKPVAKAAPAKKAAPVMAAPKVVATKPVAKAAPKVVAKAAPKVVATKPVAKAAPVMAAPVMKAAPVKPKPVVKPAPVKAVAKPAPVKAVAKPAPVKAVAKPAPVKVVAKPAPVKVVAKPAPAKVVFKAAAVGSIPSKAIPGELAPALLDGSLVGDVGFDPCYLSTKADLLVNYFQGITGGTGPSSGLTWYREAELMHGRICMVAVVGFIWPGLFGTFDGNAWTGADAYSYTNAVEAFSKAPSAALFQIFAFMGILEFRRINIILADGPNYKAGASQKWGQGDESFWNPLGLNYTPAEYAEKQLQEIKHARLAMVAFLGLILQEKASGLGVIDQLSGAFVAPEYASKAGYFLPEGI